MFSELKSEGSSHVEGLSNVEMYTRTPPPLRFRLSKRKIEKPPIAILASDISGYNHDSVIATSSGRSHRMRSRSSSIFEMTEQGFVNMIFIDFHCEGSAGRTGLL